MGAVILRFTIKKGMQLRFVRLLLTMRGIEVEQEFVEKGEGADCCREKI